MDESMLTAKSIFERVKEMADAQERQAYLDRACHDDAELRQRVESLLRAHDESGHRPDQPAATLDTHDVAPGQWLDPKALSSAPLEGVGSRIGPYKLLQQIGEGGMGIVFMAEQQQPVHRLVAVKLIKAGMDTAQVIARFEAEQQALALMDHPNIAKVLEAGQTESGRPYFVMELVKGLPITRYCDDQRLSPQQRLELFIPVCQAIQHAHQKGIIHRDIKPSNVLIAAYDGKPAPKIIDFGVAKAMGQKLTERTLFTGFGGIIGTLAYMSPEQAEFNALDIDTRSDIYSLGVLLYELLTGSTPLSRQRLQNAALTEALRLIREEEAPRPSTRLSETKDSLASVSAQRQMEPSALLKAVRGEVDWIVMKALEKDRSRRYETATNLARDIQRHLSDEPVEAGPPSAAYRFRKLAWKHRRGLATASSLLLLFVAAVVVSISLAVWALGAEKQARKAEQEAVDERNRALAAETDAKAVLGFFQDKVLSAGRPEGQEGGLGNQVTLREAVDAAEPEIAGSFADRPVVAASIRDTLGETYRYLGEYPAAIQQHEQAVALREAELGADHTDTLISRNNLALAYNADGRTAEAIRLHEQTVKQMEAKLGSEHPTTLISRNNLASMYESAGRTSDAIRLHEQILRQREAKLDADHPDILTSRNNLASAYHQAGRTAEAISLLEQTLKQMESKLGSDNPATLTARDNLAAIYESASRTPDAIRLHEQTLKRREAKLGTVHPDTLLSRNNLAASYYHAGRVDEAIRLFEQTLKQCETKLGTDRPTTLLTRSNLALAYSTAGRTADAIALHEQTLKQREGKLGKDHLDTLISRINLAEAYRAAGRTAEAIGLHEQALKTCKAKLGSDHPTTLTSSHNLAVAYYSAGRNADAIRLYEQTLKQCEAKLGPDHHTTLGLSNNLANAYLSAGRTAEAIGLHEQNLKMCEAKLGPDHQDTIHSRNSLALSYDRARQFNQSESLYRVGLDQSRKRFGDEDPRTAGEMAKLGLNLLNQHRYSDAEPLLRDCLKTRETKQPDSWTTFLTRSQLGGALLGQKKYADAEPLLLKGYEGIKQREKTIPPQGIIRIAEALDRLIEFSSATNKPDEVKKWRAERANYPQAKKPVTPEKK